MKVNYVKTVGFRKFKGTFETEIYDVTSITGKNRSGKSNILYAIINIMLGTNLSGDDKVSLINKNSDTSYAELRFTDNRSVEHTIIRGKSKYAGKSNFLSLDGKVVTQTDIVEFYKDKKLFLSIVNPLYFLSKKTAEQKELVDKYLSEITPDNLIEVVYNKLSNVERELLEVMPKDIPTYIKEINSDIRNAENYIISLNGKIEYAQNIANTKPAKCKAFEKDEELSLARQELSYLNTSKEIIDKEKQKKIIEKLQNEILSKESECNELRASLQLGKSRYLSIKNDTIATCPTCSQHIESKSKGITISNLKSELVSKYDKYNTLETELKDLKIKLTSEKCLYHSLECNTNFEKAKRISVVEENIKQLENEKSDIDKFNNELHIIEKNILNAKNDIRNFKVEKETKQKLIDSLTQSKKIAQKLYISYIEEKMKLAKQYLKDVNIQFYSVLKTTGEIKEDFIITYKNTQLCDLSRSETIATALELANMFNQITKSHFPIFIDDYESCADYDFINEYAKNTQLIISKVKKGKLLKIADFNSDKYTIIKSSSTICGFRTMNTLHKNNSKIISKLPQVA